MPATGTATLDFGAFPGTPDTSVAVSGQTAIGAGALVEAWLLPTTTSDHSVDEYILSADLISVIAASVVAGTGFTIYGVNAAVPEAPLGDEYRIYGQWVVAWAWL
jgi:hypothetical protein